MRKELAIIFLLAATNAHAGNVQCTCPTISAKGTGDTSCSATESGGTCTVDFNTFRFEDEQAAQNLLAESVGTAIDYRYLDRREFPGGFNKEIAETIAEGDPQRLVDQLMVYILVSGVQSKLTLDRKSLGELHMTLRERKEQVREGFIYGGYVEIETQFDVRAFVTPGCIEVRVNRDDYWGMFKAFWAENRSSPQCYQQ